MVYKNYKNEKKKFILNFFTYLFYRYHRIFFGSLIWRGRKLWAFKFFLEIKNQLKLKENVEPNYLFFLSLIKISPNVLVFPYRIGGKFQGVPLPISWYKKLIFGTKWVIKLLKDKYKKIDLNNLTEVLILAIYNKGLSIKKKRTYSYLGYSNKSLMRKFK